MWLTLATPWMMKGRPPAAEPPPQGPEVHGEAPELVGKGAARLVHVEGDGDALVLGHGHDELARVVLPVVYLQVASADVGEGPAADLLLHPSAPAVVHAEYVGV